MNAVPTQHPDFESVSAFLRHAYLTLEEIKAERLRDSRETLARGMLVAASGADEAEIAAALLDTELRSVAVRDLLAKAQEVLEDG